MVTVVAPRHVQAAVYLATTRVRQTTRKRNTYWTSTLPRVVVIR
jgi:hypothetical protein